MLIFKHTCKTIKWAKHSACAFIPVTILCVTVSNEGSGETQSHLTLGYRPMSKLNQIIIGDEAASLLTYNSIEQCL